MLDAGKDNVKGKKSILGRVDTLFHLILIKIIWG